MVTMLPLGTRVTIRSVDHLKHPKLHRNLIGRLAVVGDHDNGMNILTGTGWVIRGYLAFADDHLNVLRDGPPPGMPRKYRVRGYYAPDA
jgi:hypothetical protein